MREMDETLPGEVRVLSGCTVLGAVDAQQEASRDELVHRTLWGLSQDGTRSYQTIGRAICPIHKIQQTLEDLAKKSHAFNSGKVSELQGFGFHPLECRS